MNSSPTNHFSYMRTLRLIYMAMLIGQLIFAALVVYLRARNIFDTVISQELTPFILVSFFITVIGIAGNWLIMQLNIPKIRELPTLNEKATGYRNFFIIKLVLLEVPLILNTVFYLLTGHYIFAILFGLAMVILIIQQPTAEHIRMRLELEPEEMQELV